MLQYIDPPVSVSAIQTQDFIMFLFFVAGMIERAQRYMPAATPSPGRYTPEANGSATPRTPLSSRRISSNALQEGHEGESDAERRQRELYSSQQNILREQRTVDQEKLLKVISGAVSLCHLQDPFPDCVGCSSDLSLSFANKCNMRNMTVSDTLPEVWAWNGLLRCCHAVSCLRS